MYEWKEIIREGRIFSQYTISLHVILVFYFFLPFSYYSEMYHHWVLRTLVNILYLILLLNVKNLTIIFFFEIFFNIDDYAKATSKIHTK